MKQKQIIMKEWVEANSDITGNNVNDYYRYVTNLSLECALTLGNRNGHNDKSFIGPERIAHLWKDRNDVIKIVTDYVYLRYANSPKKQDKIDRWMSKFDKDIIYTIYRSCHSNRSPEMVKRYYNKIKSSPGNNGRQRPGQLIAILVSMKNWNNDSGFDTDKVALHIERGSKLLGTDNKVFIKTAKRPRVTNLYTQPTVKKITVDNRIIHEID